MSISLCLTTAAIYQRIFLLLLDIVIKFINFIYNKFFQD